LSHVIATVRAKVHEVAALMLIGPNSAQTIGDQTQAAPRPSRTVQEKP
jgi:hypothetical protein